MDFSTITAPEAPPEKKPYWQVVDEYKQFLAQNPDLQGQVDLPGFSQRATDLGQGDYSEGLHDNAIRRGQANIERSLRHFGGRDPGGSFSLSELLGGSPEGVNLPQQTGGLVQRGAQALGAGPELSGKLERVGESFPRMAVDLGVGGSLGGPIGMGAMSGLGAYGETGKLAPSILAGATAAIFPKVSELAGQGFLRAVGAPTLADAAPNLLSKATKLVGDDGLIGGKSITEWANQLVPGSLAQSVGKYGAQQAGMFSLAEGSEATGTLISEDDNKLGRLEDQLNPSSLAATAFGQLPFSVADLASPHQRPTSNLEKQVLPGLKQEFAAKFDKTYTDQYGKPPDANLAKRTIDRLLSSKPRALFDEPAVGSVLSSMDINPTVSLDLKRPVKTTEGDWNMGDAIESTKSVANNLAKAQQLPFEFGQAHDPRIYTALRQLEGQKLSKDDLSRQAASIVVDTMQGDNRNLNRVSGDYARLEQSERKNIAKDEAQIRNEAEITDKVTPKLEDGTPNVNYDPQLALRIALTSGDPQHRLDVGIDRPVSMNARRGANETIPLDVSIIDKVRGLFPKHGEVSDDEAEIQNLQARIVELDKEIADTEKQGDLFDNPELDHLKGQRIQLQSNVAELAGSFGENVEGYTRGAQLTAEATYAARYAALKYPGTVDINNPESVRNFYEYVKSAINRAETGFSRSRANSETYRENGQVVRFATEDLALAKAKELNKQRDYNDSHKFYVDPRKDKDGKVLDYSIYKQNFFSTFGDEGAKVGSGVPQETESGVDEDVLSKFGDTLNQFDKDHILDAMHELNRLPDPAVREGRKAALTQNVIDFAGSVPDSTISSLLKDETGSVSIREPAKIKARIVKFMQFVRDGGDVTLKYTKEGNRVKVVGEGDIAGFNNYLGDLGFSDKRAKWALNAPSTGGLNFFEQFHVVSRLFKQEFVDPRNKRMDVRPRGDFAWVPPGFVDDIENSLVVDPKEWEGHKAPFAASKGEWPKVDNGVEEGGVVVLKDASGKTRRFAGGDNPLQTMIVKGTRYGLTTNAGTFVDMLKTYAPNTPPEFLTFLNGFVSNNFGREIRVGFGVSKDSQTKAYYHYGDDLLTGTGILLGPFSSHANKVAKLDAPESIAQHLVEELAHAHTVFSYHHDPVINAEAQRIFGLLTERHKDLMSMGGEGKFVQSAIHGLESPEEMLATVFKDKNLQDFARGIKDPGSPLGETIWDSLARLFRRVFSKIIGKDTDSLLASLTRLSTEASLSTLRNADSWGVKHEGDIYDALSRTQGQKGDLVVGRKPQKPEPRSWLDAVSRTFLPKYEGPQPANEPTTVPEVNFGKRGVPSDEVTQDDKGPYGRVLQSRLPAGEKFFYNLPDFEQDDKGQVRLGKLSVSKKGELPIVALQNAKGFDGRQLSKGEVELYRSLVPEAFSESMVNVPKLVDGLKKNGPVVEVKKLGSSVSDANQERRGYIQHQLETAGWTFNDQEGWQPPKDVVPSQRETQLADEINQMSEDVGRGNYSFISPKPESEMPGYVEGLVRVPINKADYKPASDGGSQMTGGTVKYTGPHFGSEDTNVLAFYRGYEETLPDNTKAFHVIEVQSDWGQQIRMKSEDPTGEAWGTGVLNHPLLRVYESLALKAAIQHAKEIGATKVILSDAETAMMTEGHDRSVVHPTDEGKVPYGEESISQVKGMRLHYDQTLPSAMERLTGMKGESVEVGVHKSTQGDNYSQLGRLDVAFRDGRITQQEYDRDVTSLREGRPVGSPVFRDASNQPKTQITGRSYDITNSPSEGHTLFSRTPNTNPQAVVDSMKAYSSAVAEDNGSIWFKPWKMSNFRSVFEPAFQNKMKFLQSGGQTWAVIGKQDFKDVTQQDLGRMPAPKVKPWAPSAFETMKSLFKQRGDSEENATAQAGYNLNYMSLLKGTDQTAWGSLGKSKYLGLAWGGPKKIAGLDQDAADNFSVVGRHEQTHIAGAYEQYQRWETKDVRDAMDYMTQVYTNLSPEERATTLDGLVNLTKETRKIGINPYEDALTDPHEFVSEFMSHAGDLLENSPNPSALVRDMLRFAPDEVSNLVTYTSLRRHQAMDILDKSIVNSAAQRGIRPLPALTAVRELRDTFKSIARESMDIALDQAEFYRMRNMYPDMYQPLLLRLAKRLDDFAKLPNAPGGENDPAALLSGRVLQSREPQLYTDIKRWAGMDTDERKPDKPSLWTRMVAQFALFTDQHPIARPFYDMLESVQGQEKHAIAQVATLLAGSFEGGKVLDDRRTKQIVQFVKSSKMRDLFSSIALDVQTEGDNLFREKRAAVGDNIMAVPEIDIMTPEYMDAIYKKYGVTANERTILDTVFTGTRNQIKAVSAKIVQSHFTALETIATTAIQRNTGLVPEAARSAAKVLSQAVELGQEIAAGRSADINGQADLEHQFMQAVPDQKVQQRLLSLMTEGWEQGRNLERFLSVRMPYYMSERRPGQFGLWWKGDDNKIVRHYFKSSDERAKFVVKQDIDPIKQTDPGDRNFGVDESVFGYLDEIHQKLIARLNDTFGPDEGNKLAVLMDAASELRNALSARDALKTTTPRKGAPTREFLDMFDVHQSYIRSVLSAAKNRQMKLEAELLTNAAEFANQPFMKNQLMSHLNNVIKPDTEMGRLVQAVNFTYFMGGNLSSMIIEPLQQLSALAPTLTAHGATVKDSYKYLGMANKAWIESKSRGNAYKDPEINSMMTRARNEGVVDQGILSELEHNQDLAMINRLRATNGLGEWSLFDMLKNRVYQMANLARRFYGVVPAYNSEIAFVASLMHAKEQGKVGEQAFSDARFYTRQAMFGGGKVNRPIGLFDMAPRTAAQAMWSLQSYGTSMMTMMGHLVKRSLNPKGLTPAQAVQTRKAAVQMVTTQFALAGALGMPFVQVGMLALQKLFPDLHVEETVRDAIANLAGDDEASGGWLGQMLQMGVPTALSGTDFGSRFALSSTLGVSPYSDFSFSNFVGPTASVVTNVFKALQAGANGEPAKAAEELIPRGPLRLWKAMEEQHGFMNRGNGKMLANDLSPLEIGARAVGFTPSRIQRLMDSERLQGVAQQAEKSAQQHWVDQSAEGVMGGKDAEVQQSIAQRAVEKRRDPADLAKAVAQRVEQRTLPQDTNDLGNRATLGTQRKIRGVLGEQAQSPTNVQRLQLQQQVLQRLGVPRSMPSARAVGHASALDQLLELYPQLTTSEARLMLDRQAVRRQPGLLEGLLDTGE